MVVTAKPQSPLEQLMELRRKHGFNPPYRRRSSKKPGFSARRWSRTKLVNRDEPNLPALVPYSDRSINGKPITRNAHVYEAIAQRFPGFSWKYKTVTRANGAEQTQVVYLNYPTVGGFNPTLYDLLIMDPELADKSSTETIKHFTLMEGDTAGFEPKIQAINSTGYGYMGINGVSFYPAYRPVVLPGYLEEQLFDLGSGIFLLCDAVKQLYGQDKALTDLLDHKVPFYVPKLMDEGSVGIIRPDVVLVRDTQTGRLRFVVTELESCPGGQGLTYAIQLAYGLSTDVVDRFVQYLSGRTFTVLATYQWAEYVWEQAAFCQALRERGVKAKILFDRSLDFLHERAKRRWKVPDAAPKHIKNNWDTDFLGRLQKLGFSEFVKGEDTLPDDIGTGVIYRFGYFDNFRQTVLNKMRLWQSQGAVIVNPLQFPLESKVLMAAIRNSAVRDLVTERGGLGILNALDSYVAETRLLVDDSKLLKELTTDRGYWLTKFAAWDGNNQSWGARSLCVGSQNSVESWQDHLRGQMALGFPVIAQHVISSVRYDVAYVDIDDKVKVMPDCRTRYTPFLYRGPNGTVLLGGGSMTLRSKTFRIHGATDAVEVPVVFAD